MEVKNMRRRGRKKGEKKRGGDHNTSAITPVDHVGAALYFQQILCHLKQAQTHAVIVPTRYSRRCRTGAYETGKDFTASPW